MYFVFESTYILVIQDPDVWKDNGAVFDSGIGIVGD